MRIHLVTNLDNGKGLERDYRLLGKQLESWGHQVRGVHYQRPGQVGEADLVIFLEVYDPRLAACAPRRWLIPNAEWWRPEDAPALGDFELVLCKTLDGLSRFAPLTPRARHLGFFSEDHWDPSVPRARHFLHVAGGSNAKGTDLVLAAWERHRIPYPLTIVSSLDWGRRPRNVELVGRVDPRRLRWQQNTSRFHLCPSRYEGWGHGIHEGLSVGAAVLVPDTGAMNEIDGCALRMPARAAGRQGLVGTHLVDPDDIRNAVERCAAFTDAELQRIQDTARDAFSSERERFIANLWEVLGERPSRAARATAPPPRAPRTDGTRLVLRFSCDASKASLVRRSVLALRAQTADPSSFEVVVACDGDDPGGAIRAAVEPGSHPFRVEVIEGSPLQRHPVGDASGGAVQAPLIWSLDADLLLPPEAIQYVLSEHDTALARGVPAVLAPVRARVAMPLTAWLERSAPWAASGSPEAFVSLMAEVPLEGGVLGGHADRFRPGAPSSETLPDGLDGAPVVWRGLAHALGDFAPPLAGHDAEKEALIDLLDGVQRAGLIDARLLTSVRAIHQPREIERPVKSPRAPRGPSERERRAQEIRQGARWWRERLSSIRASLRSSVMDAAPITGASTHLPDCSPEAIEARLKLVRVVRAVAAPRLRGLYGGVVVVGESAELLAHDVVRVCGLATRVVSTAGLAALPANHACGAILSNVFASVDVEEKERILGQARRVVKATGPLVIAEIVSSSGGIGAPAGRDGLVPEEVEIRVYSEHVGVRDV